MSASATHLAGLPTEILEYALLFLPGQDIIKMEAVRILRTVDRTIIVERILYDLGQPTVLGPYS